MKNLFEEDVYVEIRERLAQLSPNSTREWGKMSPAQMLHHCQAPLNIMLEKDDYGLKPNWLAKVIFKKSLYSDKPWRKNLPTARAMKETEERDFEQEKEALVTLLEEVHDKRNKDDWPDHPAFGHFTKEQYGKMQYKHLDHHLRQFGL